MGGSANHSSATSLGPFYGDHGLTSGLICKGFNILLGLRTTMSCAPMSMPITIIIITHTTHNI